MDTAPETRSCRNSPQDKYMVNQSTLHDYNLPIIIATWLFVVGVLQGQESISVDLAKELLRISRIQDESNRLNQYDELAKGLTATVDQSNESGWIVTQEISIVDDSPIIELRKKGVWVSSASLIPPNEPWITIRYRDGEISLGFEIGTPWKNLPTVAMRFDKNPAEMIRFMGKHRRIGVFPPNEKETIRSMVSSAAMILHWSGFGDQDNAIEFNLEGLLAEISPLEKASNWHINDQERYLNERLLWERHLHWASNGYEPKNSAQNDYFVESGSVAIGLDYFITRKKGLTIGELITRSPKYRIQNVLEIAMKASEKWPGSKLSIQVIGTNYKRGPKDTNFEDPLSSEEIQALVEEAVAASGFPEARVVIWVGADADPTMKPGIIGEGEYLQSSGEKVIVTVVLEEGVGGGD